MTRLFLSVVLATGLVGCSVTKQVKHDIFAGSELTQEQIEAQRAAQRGEVLKLDRPYYGSEIKADRGTTQGKPFPKALEGPHGVAIRLSNQADILTIAEVITQVSDIPVNVRTRYVLPDSSVVEVPVVSRMSVNYEGSLSKLMDQIAGRMDVAWTHEDGGIVIDRMITRDYRVSLPTTNTSLNSTLSGATGTEESGISIGVTTDQKSEPWVDLEARLAVLTPDPAHLTILRSSGRVSVFAPPSVHKKVRVVLKDVEKIYGQRVGLEVGVYFLAADEAENFGIGTSNFTIGQGLARAGSSIVIGGGTGGQLSLGDSNNNRVDLDALARDSSVIDYRLASTIAQSGQVAPIAITHKEVYIKSTKVTTEGSGDSSSTSTEVEPGEVTYGLSIHALPRVIDDNRIQLFLTVLQLDLVGGAVEQIGPDDNQIGVPKLDQRAIQNQSILSPGETLVLSGYEQNLSSTSNTGVGFLKAIGLGGKVNAQTRKVRMVVLVRPTLIGLGNGKS